MFFILEVNWSPKWIEESKIQNDIVSDRMFSINQEFAVVLSEGFVNMIFHIRIIGF